MAQVHGSSWMHAAAVIVRVRRGPSVVAVASLLAAVPAVAGDVVLCSDESEGELGASLAWGGDYDGDGVADWIVGEPDVGDDENTGRILVYSGAHCGVLLVRRGTPDARFGQAVAWVSDLDGDGCDEVLVGEPDRMIGTVRRGRAYVLRGRTGAELEELVAPQGDRHFGESLARLGDVDGDGFEDWAVGAPSRANDHTTAGSVTVYSGATRAPMFHVDGGPDSPSFGRAIGSLGDVDGDGTREWIVGYPEPRDEAPGQVIVYSGADASPIHALEGVWQQDRFGYDVSAIPDLDGDGVEDFLVGAPTEPNRRHGNGNIHLFSGASGVRLRVLDGDEQDYSWFGGSFELVHDFDADGWPDLGIAQELSLRIVSGRSFEPILARHTGPQSFASVPDRDGDGRPELVLADFGSWGGSMRVRSIQDAPVLREWHGESGDRFGEVIWAGEDLDGDGVQELAIVARSASDRRMQIVSPVDGSELLRLDVESKPSDFAWLDDLDGDGRPEIAASWSGSNPRVTIHSGATGLTLHVLQPTHGSGAEIAALGDLDGDARADLAVLDADSVEIYSTASFRRLLDLPEVAPGSGFGESILALGDVDGDGWPDVFVTDEGRQVAYAFSGRDGSLLHTIQAPEPYTAFGREAFAPVDMDRDGTIDVFVWSAGLDVLYVYSGATLEPLTTLEVTENNFGERVANGGDIDGDGWDDVLVGSGVWNRVFALSSATQAVLWTLDLDWARGETFAGPGDVDGDGYADIAIGSPHDNLGGLDAGAVRIFPGGCTAPEPVLYCEHDAVARIGWQGSTSIAQNDFVLTVTASASSQPGLFVMSDAKSDQPFGEGRRCVGDPLYRFPIQKADAGGAATRHVDFGAPPALGRIVPSSAWFFQWWFRAPSTPSAFDASDGLAATFCR